MLKSNRPSYPELKSPNPGHVTPSISLEIKLRFKLADVKCWNPAHQTINCNTYLLRLPPRRVSLIFRFYLIYCNAQCKA